MSSKNYIAIDLGATSGRVILSSIDENKHLKMDTLYRFQTPLIEKHNKYFWDIYSIVDNIIKGLKLASGYKIESIGIDTWGVDFVLIGKNGELLSLPRAYRDPYTADIPEKFFKEMPAEDLYNRTGIQIMNFNSVFQFYAQHLENPEIFEQTSKVLFMPDAIKYLLTGDMVCEYTILSTSAIMNPRIKSLDNDILKLCGLSPDKFPEIVYPGDKPCILSKKISDITGLNDVPVITVAGHDTASAVAAIPAIKEKFAYLSSGTWSLMGIETKEPIITKQMQQLNYTNEGGINGTTRVLKNITGMWLLESCLSIWKKEGFDYSYKEIEDMARTCPKSNYTINPNDPIFSAPQNMPNTIKEYCKSHQFDIPASNAEIVRLIYDSLSTAYASVLNNLRSISPFPIEVLHVIGGGSQNKLLNQLTANVCGINIIAGPAECTAIGNIMIQSGLSRKDLYASIQTEYFKPE